MTSGGYTLMVDVPEPGVLRLELTDERDNVLAFREMPYAGHVDNLLLTAFDNLVQESNLDRSVPITVTPGSGIDKNSALCRIVQSFASALGVGHTGR